MRAWEPFAAARAAANGAGLAVIDAPVLASGRLELRWYLREQAVSRVLHRYGSMVEPAATDPLARRVVRLGGSGRAVPAIS